MARIRSIKPEITESETLAELPLAVCWTFACLWPHCDDRGRRKAQPRLVLADLYPLRDDVSVEDMTEHLVLLAEHELTCLYTGCDGKPYLHVVNWDEHQKVDRPSKSRIPPCRTHEPDGDCARHEGNCESLPLALAEPSPNPREDASTGSRTLDLGPRTVDLGSRTVPTTSGALALADTDANVGAVVAAYADGARQAGLPKPTERLRGKVGRDAKRLAEKDHIPIPALIIAARSMGSRGWDDLDRELQRVAATTSRASPGDERMAGHLALINKLAAEEQR